MPEYSYIVEAVIAAGPSAKVYRGIDQATGQRVRLKALLGESASVYALDAHAVGELAEHLVPLQNPHVGRLLAVDAHEEEVTLVTELPEGMNAWQFVQQRILQAADVRAVASQLVMALMAGEQLGLRHGDVKPSNLILADHPAGGIFAQLQDWGQSECRHEQPRETLQFRALERLRGERGGAAADLFSVGATLTTLLLGRAPVEGGSAEELHAAWAEFDPVVLRHARPDVEPGVHDWLAWLLRADSALRPASAAQAYEVLASTTGFLVPAFPMYAMPVWQPAAPTAPLVGTAAGTATAPLQPAAPVPSKPAGPPVPKPRPPGPSAAKQPADSGKEVPKSKKRSKRVPIAIVLNLIALGCLIAFLAWMGVRWGSDWPSGLRKLVVETFLGGHVGDEPAGAASSALVPPPPSAESPVVASKPAQPVAAAAPAPKPASRKPSKPAAKSAEPPLAKSGGITAQFVRVEIPGTGTLNLAEVEVFAGGENIARKGKATAKSTDWGGRPPLANDGNTSGDWKRKSIYHSKDSEDTPWWEVDLGKEQSIQAIKVWNRTDGSFAKRLTNYTVIALNKDRREVWRTDKQSVPSPAKRYDLPGAR